MGIKYLDEPKSRIRYLDESDKYLVEGKEVSEKEFFSPRQISTRNPLKAAVVAASNWIPFGDAYLKAPEWLATISPLVRVGKLAAMQRKIVGPVKIEGLPAQLAYGATAAAPLLAGTATPFIAGAGKALSLGSKIPVLGKALASPLARSALGFAGYEAARHAAGGQIKDIPQAAKSGAISGAVFHTGARTGSTLAQPLQRLTRFGTRIGSAAGAGAASAAMAPKGEKVSSAIIGGAFGGKYPAEPFGYKTPQALVKEAGGIIRRMIRPSKGDISLVESVSGKKIDKYMELMAKERLPLEKTSSGEMDTSKATEILSDKIGNIHNKLNAELTKNTTKQFDLELIRNKAIKKAKEIYKDSKTRKEEIKDINDYINADIEAHGRFVDGSTLNTIKQGKWDIAYNLLKPTTHKNARIIGRYAKEAIESGYPENVIKSLNEQSSDLNTLKILLGPRHAHGRVVPRGRLGGYFGTTLGGMIGLATEPIFPGFGIAPAVGAGLGKMASDYISSPGRAVKRAGKRIGRAERLQQEPILDRLIREQSIKRRTEILPEDYQIPINPRQRLNVVTRQALPSPRDVPYNPSGLRGQFNPLRTPNVSGEGVIPLNAPYKGTTLPAVVNNPRQPMTPQQMKQISGMKMKTGILLRPQGQERVVPREIKEKNISTKGQTDPLIQEAKQYKSAEEFVKQVESRRLQFAETGKPIRVKLYHGSPDARFSEEFDANKKGYFKELPEALADNKEFISLEGGINQGFKGKSITGNIGVSFTDDYTTAKSYADKPAFDYQNSVPMVLERYVTFKNPKVYDLEGKEWNLSMEEEMRKALSEGHDGLIFKNIRDDYHPSARNKPTNNAIALNVDQIKTKSQLTDIWKQAHGKK